MSNYYVYVYLDTRKPGFYSYCGLNNIRFIFEYEPFYIGKGKNYRMNEHLTETLDNTCNSFKVNVINKIRQQTQYEPKIERYLSKLTEQESYDLEKSMIKVIGRRDKEEGPLTNLTDGGTGGNSEWTKEKRNQQSIRMKKKWEDDIYRQQMSICNSGISNYFYNKDMSGKNNGMFGRKHTNETKKILSELKKGNWIGDNNPMKNPEYVEKVRKSKIGSKNPIHAAKMGKSHRKKYKLLNNGKVFTTDNIILFCKEHNISSNMMKGIASGNIKQPSKGKHKEWICSQI